MIDIPQPMTLASTSAVVAWAVILAGAGWTLAAGLLRPRRRRKEATGDAVCRYCAWPVGRSSRWPPIRWQGEVFCGLVCLRRDEELRRREDNA